MNANSLSSSTVLPSSEISCPESLQNPIRKKFGAVRNPFTPNPGDLRYLGKDLHLYIIPDDTLGAPRLFAKDSFRYPQTLHRASYPGAGTSEYILTRILPGMNEQPPITVRQSFAVIGDALAVVFDSSAQNAGLAYGVTMPLTSMTQKDNTVFLHQPGIANSKQKLLTVTGYNLLPALVRKERRTPFFRNEMRINGKQEKLPGLRLVQFPFGKGSLSALLFSPEGKAEQIRFSEKEGMLLLEFTTGSTEYTAVLVPKPVNAIEFRTKNGIRITGILSFLSASLLAPSLPKAARQIQPLPSSSPSSISPDASSSCHSLNAAVTIRTWQRSHSV